jgi:hypothetical protein
LIKKKDKKKRKHLPKLTALRNKLDKLFNKYIRLRDGACVLTSEKENLSCSHYYDKKNNPYLRWDERNAHAMTIKKHWLHHHGKAPDYALWMFKTYGFKFMAKLAKDANRKVKYKRVDYIRLIELYTNKLESLKEKQNANN